MLSSPNDEIRSRQQPVKEDIGFFVRSCRLEGIGKILLALLMLLALLGVFSDGVLSDTWQQNDEVRVFYPRFVRQGAEILLRIEIADDKEGALTISDSLLRKYRINSVFPPSNMVITDDALLFAVVEEQRSSHHVVLLSLQVQEWGRTTFDVARQGGPALTVTQWIYP